MTTKIETLVDDINRILEEQVPEELINEFLKDFDDNLSLQLKRQLIKREAPDKGTLRMSNLGTPCARKLWYSVNTPNDPKREKLRGDTKLKFMFGDLTEEMMLFLTRLAGHNVEGEQEEVGINGIKGHIDAIIDGCLVDVKSASKFGFRKFKENKLLEDDPFGYIPQAMAYLYALQDDPRLVEKDKAYFLAFCKDSSQVVLDHYEKPDWFDLWPELVDKRVAQVSTKDPAERGFEDEEDGKSGNRKLGLNCSYCDFKQSCWPGLRTFISSRGPLYLTEVKREPRMMEITENES